MAGNIMKRLFSCRTTNCLISNTGPPRPSAMLTLVFILPKLHFSDQKAILDNLNPKKFELFWKTPLFVLSTILLDTSAFSLSSSRFLNRILLNLDSCFRICAILAFFGQNLDFEAYRNHHPCTTSVTPSTILRTGVGRFG